MPGGRSRSLLITLENNYGTRGARKVFVQAGKWTNRCAGEDLVMTSTGLEEVVLSTPAPATGGREAAGARAMGSEANGTMTFGN